MRVRAGTHVVFLVDVCVGLQQFLDNFQRALESGSMERRVAILPNAGTGEEGRGVEARGGEARRLRGGGLS